MEKQGYYAILIDPTTRSHEIWNNENNVIKNECENASYGNPNGIFLDQRKHGSFGLLLTIGIK